MQISQHFVYYYIESASAIAEENSATSEEIANTSHRLTVSCENINESSISLNELVEKMAMEVNKFKF